MAMWPCVPRPALFRHGQLSVEHVQQIRNAPLAQLLRLQTVGDDGAGVDVHVAVIAAHGIIGLAVRADLDARGDREAERISAPG